MTPQEDSDALQQLSTEDKSERLKDSVWLLFWGLGSSITLAYLLVYGELRFDRLQAKYGVPSSVSEIALWGVAVMFYIFAIVGAWMLKSEVKSYRLGRKCALVFAVLLTAPVGFVAVLFLWNILNSLPREVWLIVGFLVWQNWIVEVNNRKFVAIVKILTDIQQSVRNIEKEKT